MAIVEDWTGVNLHNSSYAGTRRIMVVIDGNRVEGKCGAVRSYLRKEVARLLAGEDYEGVRDLADMLNDLWDYEDDTEVVVSDHNGMGWGVEAK